MERVRNKDGQWDMWEQMEKLLAYKEIEVGCMVLPSSEETFFLLIVRSKYTEEVTLQILTICSPQLCWLAHEFSYSTVSTETKMKQISVIKIFACFNK